MKLRGRSHTGQIDRLADLNVLPLMMTDRRKLPSLVDMHEKSRITNDLIPLLMPKFVPGLKLCKLFYQQEVTPILNKTFPKLRYSAAIIGWGSEVLGFDTPISRDHHWGPRVLLFLTESDYKRRKGKIREALSDQLPFEFMGYSTNYSEPEPNGVRHPVKITRGRINHMVNIYTVRSFFKARLLRQVWLAKTWKTREQSIAKAYSVMAQQHNELRITKLLTTNTSRYYGRPYSVIHGERFAKAIKQAIDNPFSEAQFRTMKYRPEFPERFGSLQDSRAFCQPFFDWYNNPPQLAGASPGAAAPALH